MEHFLQYILTFFLNADADLKIRIYAFLGGVVPALVWLAFWLREDSKKPEPKSLILRTFIYGMASVILVLPFQQAVNLALPGAGLAAFLLWAVLEELFKFAAAFAGGLYSKENNEPLDGLVYMITAALGFAALENALFIVDPLKEIGLAGGVVTGGIRFIGSSLLHTVSSGIVGIVLAFSFYKSKNKQVVNVIGALILAILIHTAFNLFLMHESNLSTPMAFAGVWFGTAMLLLFFERIKALHSKRIKI